MKKQFYFLALVLFMSQVTLALPSGNASLNIKVNEPGAYQFEINGKLFPRNTSSIQLNNIRSGRYAVTIYKRVAINQGRQLRFKRVKVYQNFILVPNRSNVSANYNRNGMQIRKQARFRHRAHYRNRVCRNTDLEPRNYRSLEQAIFKLEDEIV